MWEARPPLVLAEQAEFNQVTRERLEMLWAQSAELRAHAMAARMAAMEARAIARSLRLQRPASSPHPAP